MKVAALFSTSTGTASHEDKAPQLRNNKNNYIQDNSAPLEIGTTSVLVSPRRNHGREATSELRKVVVVSQFLARRFQGWVVQTNFDSVEPLSTNGSAAAEQSKIKQQDQSCIHTSK